MNTQLDGPLSVWFGRCMVIAGIFGVLIPTIWFTTGINTIPGIVDEANLGFGAIIASNGLGIGGAFVVKTRRYKKMKEVQK